MEIVLASGNQGKLRELGAMLKPANISLIAQSDLGIEGAEETGLSFIENALLKARHASEKSGKPALADDSGLAVDALGGAPGIYSARFAGPSATDQQNIDKLLLELRGVSAPDRSAQFHCVLAYVRHAADPVPIVCHGVWEGLIAEEQSGQAGFGYDPVFLIPDLNCTAAELTKEHKSQLSHRGEALRQLAARLPEINIAD